MKRSMKKLAAIVIIAAIGTFIWVALADAQPIPRSLRGEYAFTGKTDCLISRFGFNTNLTPNYGTGPGTGPDNVYIQSYSVQGIWRFNVDGTGTLQGRLVGIGYNAPGLSAASSADFKAAFTYSVGPNYTITTQLSSPLTATTLTGPRTGQTFMCDKLSLTGIISENKKGLTLTTSVPQIETVTYSNGDVQPRICHRSHILLRPMRSNFWPLSQ